ncbi:MAG: O-antigen ligase family protein [Gammaproteobacteria bacterium]|nr:O-antigen ligase family protein [Gammaproteobacteria bacterium]
MKYIIYAIFFLMAFTNTALFGHIYLVEIPTVIGLFMLLSHRDNKALVFNMLDRLVIIYAIFSFLSVVVGLDSLYESARYYRLVVVTPVLIYMVIRFGASSIQQLQKAVFLIIPGTFYQGLLLVQYYVVHGERPVGVEGTISVITLSVLIAFSLFIMLFNFPKKLKLMMNMLRYSIIAMLFIMLVISGARAGMLGFVMMVVAIYIGWQRKSRRVWIGRLMLSAISVLLILIISGSILFKDVKVEDAHDRGVSVDRLFDIDMYLWDIRGRVAFWGRIANQALEHPLLGSGAASHDIGKTGGTEFSLGSAHNILVSTLRTSGVLGLAILLALIGAFYRVFKVIDNDRLTPCVLGKSVLGAASVLLMVAITNDFSGGRVFIWFLLLAMAARILNELPRMAMTGVEQVNDKNIANKLLVKRSTSVVHLRT